jgi:hypothetical protein
VLTNPQVTRARIAAVTAAGSLLMLVSWASAPAARAAQAGHSRRSSGIPASAEGRLIRETLAAWQITKGEGVTVAVLSTPVDAVNGLSGKVRHSPAFAPLAGAPATAGTVLASLIAGSGPTASNPFGSVGRSPGAKILAEQIVDYGGGTAAGKYQINGVWQNIEAKAIRYAANHRAKVIVTFECGYSDQPALASAVAYAVKRKDVVLGSECEFGSTPNAAAFPDSLPGVINFSGTTIRGMPKPTRPVHSPANNSILVTAPANILYAEGPGNAPYYAFGEYAAIAWVAGTVALIKSVYPQITPAQVARALAVSASYHPHGGYNTRIGFGLINPQGALHAAGDMMKLHVAASPGAGVVGAATMFGSPAPGVVDAVPHPVVELAGYGVALAAGLALLVLARRMARRKRVARDG